MLFKIKDNNTADIRRTLHFQDIEKLDVLTEFGAAKHVVMEGLEYYSFVDPFPMPKFNKYYANKVKSVKDPYLKEVLLDLLYLNPNPAEITRKKMCEVVLRNFVLHTMGASQNTDRPIAVPVITHEEVMRELVLLVGQEHTPKGIDTLLLSKYQKFTPAEKREIRGFIRGQAVQKYYDMAIGLATAHLIETFPLTKLTFSKISNYGIQIASGKNRGQLASPRTISNNTSENNKAIMDDHNDWVPFRSHTQEEKFWRFVKLQEQDRTLDRASRILEISRSTVIEFREWMNQGFHEELRRDEF